MNKQQEQQEFLAWCDRESSKDVFNEGRITSPHYRHAIKTAKAKYIEIHGDGKGIEWINIPLFADRIVAMNKQQEFLSLCSEDNPCLDDEGASYVLEYVREKYIELHGDGNGDRLSPDELSEDGKPLLPIEIPGYAGYKNQGSSHESIPESGMLKLEKALHERLSKAEGLKDSTDGNDHSLWSGTCTAYELAIKDIQDAREDHSVHSHDMVEKNQPVKDCHALNPRTTQESIHKALEGEEAENQPIPTITRATKGSSWVDIVAYEDTEYGECHFYIKTNHIKIKIPSGHIGILYISENLPHELSSEDSLNIIPPESSLDGIYSIKFIPTYDYPTSIRYGVIRKGQKVASIFLIQLGTFPGEQDPMKERQVGFGSTGR